MSRRKVELWVAGTASAPDPLPPDDTPDGAPHCGVEYGYGDGLRYACTERRGIHPTGNHRAGTGQYIVAVWPVNTRG